MATDTDWNDKAKKHGIEAVKKPVKAIIDAAKGKPFGNFTIKLDGVYFTPLDKDGKPKQEIFFCSYLSPVGLARNVKGADYSILFEMKNPDNNVIQFLLSLESLHLGGGEVARIEFAKRGGSFGAGIRTKQAFADFVNSIMKNSRNLSRITLADRTGWLGLPQKKTKVFVLPDTTIGTTAETVILKQGADAAGYETAGDLAGWKKDIAAPATGNSRVILAISISFAAPLLHVLHKEGGGFHLNGTSSEGKTTVIRCGASVVGNPEREIKPMNATANSFEAEAALCNDSTLFLDELGEAPPEQIGSIIYKLAGGKGRGRADKKGNAAARNSWECLFMTTGETDITNMMKTANRKTFAGQELRLANIPADAGNSLGVYEQLHGFQTGAALSDHFRKATGEHHGVAFREHLTRLVHDINTDAPALHDRLTAYIKNFIHDAVPDGADGQVQRVASRFALVAAGGELASHYGVTGWSEGEASWGALTCFNAWLDRRGGIGQTEITKLLEQVESFFDRHGESCFVLMDGDERANKQPVIDRYGFRNIVHLAASDETRTEYFVLPSRFRDIVSGFDYRWSAKTLAEHGIIKGDGKASYIRKALPGVGQQRCYHFPAVIDAAPQTDSIRLDGVPF